MAESVRTNAAEAWTIFWADQGPRSRCFARAPELSELLDAHWRGFASALPASARVIDLGCGAGAVGRALLSEAPGLSITGIDSAEVPASSDPNLRLRSRTTMESLPFADRSFEAAASQFGYEYAPAEAAAKEIARILIPDAPFSFLVHHPDSPIVADMRRHRRAIEGLCGLRVQAAFFSGNANDLADRFADLKRECADDPIVEHAERGLCAHLRNDQSNRLQIWKAVTEALAPELFMLDSLDLCCAGDQEVHDHIEPLTQWFDVRLPAVVRTRAGQPIAWEVHGTRL